MSQQLFEKVKTVFINKFTTKNPLLVASPGRINLIGEHTDYNNGFVFPATIDKYIVSALFENNENVSRIYSADFDKELVLNLDNLEKQESGSWENYIIGVIYELQKEGKNIKNFDLVFGGNIPIGAGISSSAALENSIVFGLNELFDLKLCKEKMILISQRAEHYFAGVACGIMDQFSNMYGKEDHAIFLNCSDLTFEYVPIHLDSHQFLVINTNVKHKLADSPYNKRKEECKEGLRLLKTLFPQLNSLCDANLNQLKELEANIPDKIYQRCLYVIEENMRVKASKIAIENNNWDTFGQLLYASHHGLQYQFEVSCTELDFIVEKAKKESAVIGSRMIGGGFGGCTINLIQNEGVNAFKEFIADEYLLKFGHPVDIYPVQISNGTQVIEV